MKTKWNIIIDLLLAMFCCLIVIAVMRWVATPLVWLSILGVITLLGFGESKNAMMKTRSWKIIAFLFVSGTYYSFKQYKNLKDRPPTEVNVHTNLSLVFDTWLQDKNTWLYLGIAAAVVLVIILLVVLVLRKRIVIAIALVKEGSKYVNWTIFQRIKLIYDNFSSFRVVSSIYSTVFFPILPWIFQIAVTAFAVAVGLYLASIGQPVNQVLRMSTDFNCQCTGKASHYKV